MPYFLKDNKELYTFLSYDDSWDKTYFDSKSKGYVVTEKSRIRTKREDKENDEEYNIFKKEQSMCKVFADNGYKIEHLNEMRGISSPDVTINGVPADLKKVTTIKQIVKHGNKAIKKQGASLVLFQFDTFNGYYSKKLKDLAKNGIHGKYFVTGENIVHDF